MIAALATGSAAAITIALTHLLFNVCGMLLIYCIPPVRRLPLWLATKMGDLAQRNRALAVAYIVVGFYLLPALALFLSGAFASTGAPSTTPLGG
jgi:sodium-dependent phosphate cotransporter